jgi:hypothetical protein
MCCQNGSTGLHKEAIEYHIGISSTAETALNPQRPGAGDASELSNALMGYDRGVSQMPPPIRIGKAKTRN